MDENLIFQDELWRFRDYEIPQRMRPSIIRYVQHGIIPGRFLQAVICNNLKEAVGQADDENIHQLPAYVAYFYNHAPAPCWGSLVKMKAWHKRKRKESEVDG